MHIANDTYVPCMHVHIPTSEHIYLHLQHYVLALWCRDKDGVFVCTFRYNIYGCCSGCHGNFSVKAGRPWKQFDLKYLPTVAIFYANTIVDTFPLKPLFHVQGYYGNHCSTPYT